MFSVPAYAQAGFFGCADANTWRVLQSSVSDSTREAGVAAGTSWLAVAEGHVARDTMLLAEEFPCSRTPCARWEL